MNTPTPIVDEDIPVRTRPCEFQDAAGMVIVKAMTTLQMNDNQCIVQLPHADLDRVLAKTKTLHTTATETYALSNGKISGDDYLVFDMELLLT